MPFDPETWLGVADVCLLDIPGAHPEALLRTAASRAYYAALLTLKLRIERAQGAGSVPSSRTHEALLQALLTAGEEMEDVYLEMKALQQFRNRADYELGGWPMTRGDTTRLISRGKRLVWNILRPMPDAAFKKLKVPRYD